MSTYIIHTLDGSASAPAHSFTNDPDCGLYRIGANNIGFAIAGGKVLDLTSAGLSITGTVTSSGAGSFASLNLNSNNWLLNNAVFTAAAVAGYVGKVAVTVNGTNIGYFPIYA